MEQKLNKNFHPIINSKEYYDYLYSDRHMSTAFVNGRIVKLSSARRLCMNGFFSQEDVAAEERKKSARATKNLANIRKCEQKRIEDWKSKVSIDMFEKLKVLDGKERRIRKQINLGKTTEQMAAFFLVSPRVMAQKLKMMETDGQQKKALEN